METWEIICQVAGEMGYRFKMKYAGVEEVTAEIARVVPIYRGVDIDGDDSESIWDLSGFLLEPREARGERTWTDGSRPSRRSLSIISKAGLPPGSTESSRAPGRRWRARFR